MERLRGRRETQRTRRASPSLCRDARRTRRASSGTGRDSRRMGRASLRVSIVPSRARRVARAAAKDARGTWEALRRARTAALDLRGASVVNCGGIAPHGSGVPTYTSGGSPSGDGSCRSPSGSPRRKERGRRHAQGCLRSWDCSSRSSQRPSAWRRTLYPFRRMPYSFVGASWSAPTAAPRDRSDALEEAWAAVPEEGDALREPRDSLLEPRDTLGIRGDAVRRQGRDSRRVTRSSRSSCRGGSVSEAATRTRGAALTTQGDASQAARDALDGIRDAQRKEDDARGEAPKPVPTSSSGSPVRRADTTARDVRRGIRRSVTRVGAHWCTSQVEGAPMLCAAVPSLPCPFR